MSINSDDRPWPRTIVHDDLDWPASDQRVLVPFHEGAHRSETGLLAGSVAFGTDGELYLLHAADESGAHDADEIREQAALKREIQGAFDVPVRDHVQSYSRAMVGAFVRDHDVTTTVVDGGDARSFTGRGDGGTVPNCHTVVGTGMDEYEAPSSILVPVARGPHSGLAVKVAAAIGRAHDCWLELLHVVPTEADEAARTDAAALLDAYEYHVEDATVDHLIQEASDPAAGIVEHAAYHDLTIIGAPEKGKLRQFLFGSTADDVTRNVDHGPVLTVHRSGGESILSRWL